MSFDLPAWELVSIPRLATASIVALALWMVRKWLVDSQELRVVRLQQTQRRGRRETRTRLLETITCFFVAAVVIAAAFAALSWIEGMQPTQSGPSPRKAPAFVPAGRP